MNWKKISLVSLGVLAVLGLAAGATYLALERRFCPGCSKPAASPMQGWTHELKLTEAQKTSLQPLEAGLEKDLQRFQADLAQERMDLCQLMHAGARDLPAVEGRITRISTLEADQQRRLVRHFLAVREILTPDQRDQFFTRMMRAVCEHCRQSTGDAHACAMCRVPKR